MRERADAERIRRFLRRLGTAARSDATYYLSGGATAVLLGWRASTIDVDVRFEPKPDKLLRALPALTDELRLKVELESPADFIPLPAGWRERSPLVAQEAASRSATSISIRKRSPSSPATARSTGGRPRAARPRPRRAQRDARPFR